MAAGTSSRFVPLSYERPKGLLEVKGDILIERQIRQLQEAGISDITIVVGYKAEMFEYLKERFKVNLIYNEDYQRYNNISSVIRVLDRLGDTYICSSDNYFPENVFIENPKVSYYSALYAIGNTSEYCICEDSNGYIREVTVGGHDSWYMVGHVYFSNAFSQKFKEILRQEYENNEIRHGYWEDVYIKHIKELPGMLIHKYEAHDIEEFDSLDELRKFDQSYLNDTRSSVIKDIAKELDCEESALHGFTNTQHKGNHLLFSFLKDGDRYQYDGSTKQTSRL